MTIGNEELFALCSALRSIQFYDHDNGSRRDCRVSDSTCKTMREIATELLISINTKQRSGLSGTLK